jgi:hypothetical protein
MAPQNTVRNIGAAYDIFEFRETNSFRAAEKVWRTPVVSFF